MATMIWMESIAKNYQFRQRDVPVLRDINLSIEAGDYLALMGPSGSGKSTLLNIIGGLDRPTAGHYIFEGKNLTHLDDNTLASIRNRRIGFVFQQFNLLPQATALENVMLPLLYTAMPRHQRRQRAMQALERVGLSDRALNRPNQLSGGQQQRVAIARALVNRPALVLADEPTGALDSRTSQSIMDLLTELNQQGVTIVVVTHDPGVAQQTQRVIQMQDGSISLGSNRIAQR